VHENPGAILAQNVGVGLGGGLGDGERRRVTTDCAVCWVAGVNTLHPARVRVASKQQETAAARAWQCMPDRI